MIQTTYKTPMREIDAFITVNKSRLKNYGPDYYLNDSDEFEFELFNPNSEEVLVVISIQKHDQTNGGLILKPGERVFLDCNIATKKKFKFSTYTVEDSVAAKTAIENNGLVEIKCFNRDYTAVIYNVYPQVALYGYEGMTAENVMYDSDTTFNAQYDIRTMSVETGRVTEGNSSTQQFVSTNMKFYSIPYCVKTFKILPTSSKPVYVDEIRQYCTECGLRKRRGQWKFCPSCGKRF